MPGTAFEAAAVAAAGAATGAAVAALLWHRGGEGAVVGAPPPDGDGPRAAVVLPTPPDLFDVTLKSLTADPLAFIVLEIFPADAPHTALVEGHGCRLRLQPGEPPERPTVLEVYVDNADGVGVVNLPCNVTVKCLQHPDNLPITMPPVSGDARPEVTRADGGFGLGRAGMGYRELLPSRAGGALVASHIRVGTDGPVPDYVHYHRIRFQMIYCVRGWARLVYEDDGPPSIMRPGDCVVQPPTIRHRVLESGDSLEVVEITCPAEHMTLADPSTALPTPQVNPARTWHGQRFSWHRRGAAIWEAAGKGWHSQDLGTHAATGGVGAAVAYSAAAVPAHVVLATAEPALVFIYAVRGGAVVTPAAGGEEAVRLEVGDSIGLPAALASEVALKATALGTEVLVVSFPLAALA